MLDEYCCGIRNEYNSEWQYYKLFTVPETADPIETNAAEAMAVRDGRPNCCFRGTAIGPQEICVTDYVAVYTDGEISE